jgi:hypothetical protein
MKRAEVPLLQLVDHGFECVDGPVDGVTVGVDGVVRAGSGRHVGGWVRRVLGLAGDHRVDLGRVLRPRSGLPVTGCALLKNLQDHVDGRLTLLDPREDAALGSRIQLDRLLDLLPRHLGLAPEHGVPDGHAVRRGELVELPRDLGLPTDRLLADVVLVPHSLRQRRPPC